MDQVHRRRAGFRERKSVENRAVASSEDGSGLTGELGETPLHQVSHAPSERSVRHTVELASSRASSQENDAGPKAAHASDDDAVVEVHLRDSLIQVETGSERGRVPCQCVDHGIVARAGHGNVTDGVRNLVDLPPHILGTFEQDGIELDIETFDGRTDPCYTRPDDCDIVLILFDHDATLGHLARQLARPTAP